MLDAVTAALARDRARRSSLEEVAVLHAHFRSLTPRESDILRLIAKGLSNKEIARDLAITPETVQGFKLWMIERDAGTETQRKVITILSALLGKAVELDRMRRTRADLTSSGGDHGALDNL